MSQMSWPWAIILCKFNDLPSIPQQPQFYQDFYTKNGTGGVCDFWREVSFGSLDLTQSQVFGWFTMNHSSSELSTLQFPGDRWKLVQWGMDTAQANGVNLASFKSILVVQNWGVDHGFAGNGVIIVHKYSSPTLIEYGFISHEMGHGFGFPHSWSANPDMEYGDGWDIMSWDTATSGTSDHQISFESASGMAGPGLNARNVEALGVVPTGEIWTPPQTSQAHFDATITLHTLNQPYGGSGFVVAEIPPNATTPARPTGSKFTIEYRHKVGPDQGIPGDTVLIHEVRTNGYSYLQPGWGGQFVAGQQFVTPDPKVFVQVMSIDPSSATATVRISYTANLPTRFCSNEDWTHGPYYGSRGTFFADVTGDGRADAIVVNDNTITVRRSTGNGFSPNEDWTHGPYYGSLGTFFADVTGDHAADAIVVNQDTVTVRRAC